MNDLVRNALMGAAGGGAETVYLDDVYSTYLYKGTGGANTINNGLDISGEGGLVWVKNRTNARNSMLLDTVRGVNQEFATQSTSAQNNNTGLNQTFTSTGFTFNTSNLDVNDSSHDYTSWNFRKTTEFFDIVTYTGTGVKRTVSHNLGCKPGMIWIKRLDNSQNWEVWHHSLPAVTASEFGYVQLNTINDMTGTSRFGIPGTDDPTSSTFTVKTQDAVNASGGSYVAYLFAGAAGGVSIGAATNTGDGYMRIPFHSDLMLNGDFTMEMFVKKRGGLYDYLWTMGDSGTATGFQLYFSGQNLTFYGGTASGTATSFSVISGIDDYNWHHVAVTRDGTTMKFWFDGILVKTQSGATATYSGDIVTGENYGTGADGQGTPSRMATNISNFRITKGQVLYKSQFTPPSEKLTTTSQNATSSNVKLLCFQSTTVTDATVSPTTLVHENSAGNVTATPKAGPFTDSDTYKFGVDGEHNLIKCGAYRGNGSTAGPEVSLGWEPQWILIKNTSVDNDWTIHDSMRGIASEGQDTESRPNKADVDYTGGDYIDLLPRGFKLKTSQGRVNTSGNNYIYMCIRRSDGYVGKPAEAGTDVFAMTTGNSSGSIPNFVSGFPVDYQINRQPATSQSWYTGSRLTNKKYLLMDSAGSEGDSALYTYDSNSGWCNFNYASNYQSWMWKRHAGFDVVAYGGNSVSPRAIGHSLGKTPEMIWVKSRSQSNYKWVVGHKGLNGGTNPWSYSMFMDNTAEQASDWTWKDTPPTSTDFTVSNDGYMNTGTYTYVAYLFASVPGISKVGSYTGTGTNRTISDVGFQPRFVLIKIRTANDNWRVLDTTRGWGAGNDCQIRLSSASAQSCNDDWGAPTPTGFSLTASSDTAYNGNGYGYIYYAHA